MSEVWKAIDGFEGLYEVSNLGKVKALARSVYSTHKNTDKNCLNQEKHILKE